MLLTHLFRSITLKKVPLTKHLKHFLFNELSDDDYITGQCRYSFVKGNNRILQFYMGFREIKQTIFRTLRVNVHCPILV